MTRTLLLRQTHAPCVCDIITNVHRWVHPQRGGAWEPAPGAGSPGHSLGLVTGTDSMAEAAPVNQTTITPLNPTWGLDQSCPWIAGAPIQLGAWSIHIRLPTTRPRSRVEDKVCPVQGALMDDSGAPAACWTACGAHTRACAVSPAAPVRLPAGPSPGRQERNIA